MPVLDAHSLDFLSHGPEQTQRLGARLGELVRTGDVVCLAGDLGSGKTTFVQGLARGWGALTPATSPTFVLVNEYLRPEGTPLFHLDAFRLEPGSAAAYDLSELTATGPVVIEWPDRIRPLLPSEYLWIELRWVDETRRGLRLTAAGGRYPQLLEQFRQLAFGG